MMNVIFTVMILFSVICGIVSGKSAEVSDAAINSCVEAVELFLYLIGGMCMWGGLMKVAEKSHLTDKLAAAFRPFAKLIFKELDFNGKAFHAICLNVTANMLGLGNAATPLGIEAMKALETGGKSQRHGNPKYDSFFCSEHGFYNASADNSGFAPLKARFSRTYGNFSVCDNNIGHSARRRTCFRNCS